MRLPMNTSLATLKPSGIRRINALAAQHPGCIALALGEPDFPTPDVISAEVTAALDRGDTHYPPNNGRPALREALSTYMGDVGLTFSADEVILTDGATEALSAAFMAMLNPGDEVIIPTPAFGLYESIVVANHAKAVFLDTEPTQFQIDEDALRACVTPATKAIVICSPNNPTGCILSAASLDAVAHVAEQAGIYVVCDDVYNRLVYVDGYERFAQRHPELREQTVVIESFSKPWAMTGWRLGWLAAATPVIAEIAKAHQYLVSSAVSFEMDAAARALTVDPHPHARSLPSPSRTRTRGLRRHGPRRSRARRSLLHFPEHQKVRPNQRRLLHQSHQRGKRSPSPGRLFRNRRPHPPKLLRLRPRSGRRPQPPVQLRFNPVAQRDPKSSAHRPKHYEWGASLNGHEDSQQRQRSSGREGQGEFSVDSARAEGHLMWPSCEPRT